MNTVALSPKFQVVIPKQIREALNLISGQRMQVSLIKGRVTFEPEKTMAAMRGRWPGLDTKIVRDADRV
jgi:AbrB family looped-hinge helix DNA binding protein